MDAVYYHGVRSIKDAFEIRLTPFKVRNFEIIQTPIPDIDDDEILIKGIFPTAVLCASHVLSKLLVAEYAAQTTISAKESPLTLLAL